MDSLAITETVAAAASLLLMGACGAQLLVRLVRVLRGEESAAQLPEEAGRVTAGRATGNRATAGRATAGRAPARALWTAALVTLASRLALFALAYAMARLLLGEERIFGSLEDLWLHWDARHYMGIAESGYTNVGDERLRLVFFPLYPLLTRLAAPLTGGNAFLSGTLVSLLCASLSGALLYDLCCARADARTARLALAYFLLNPLSVFLCCVYTEALFLCLTLLTVRLLDAGRPWAAALCGAASAFTRMPGLIVAGVFLIRLLGRWPGRASRAAFARDALACLAQVALVFSGFAAYLAVNWAVAGSPTAYAVYQAENWFQRPGSFWGTTANTVHYFLTTVGESDWLFTWGFQLLTLFYAFALLALRQSRLPFDLAAYAFVYVAVVFSPTWLLSGARYLYALCCLPLLQARAHRSRAAHRAALCVCAALLVVWTFGYTLAVEVL